jgi:Fe-S-cluster-containing dehydrogenase component
MKNINHLTISVDASSCTNCQTCMLACSLWHEGECDIGLSRILVNKNMERYEIDIIVCQHCEPPECITACPTGALALSSKGIVILDEANCTLCGCCADSCPHHAIFYNEPRSKYHKCDLCDGRAEGPLCVSICPTGALRLHE